MEHCPRNGPASHNSLFCLNSLPQLCYFKFKILLATFLFSFLSVLTQQFPPRFNQFNFYTGGNCCDGNLEKFSQEEKITKNFLGLKIARSSKSNLNKIQVNFKDTKAGFSKNSRSKLPCAPLSLPPSFLPSLCFSLFINQHST